MKTLFRTLCIFFMGALLAINAVAIDVTAPMGTELSGGDFREEANDADVLNMTLPSELSLVSEHEENVEPLCTQVFQLNYVQVQTIMDALAGSNSNIQSIQLLSERGSAIADIRTNKIIVTDTAERLEHFAVFLAQLDVPRQQVMIEVHIVEAQYGWGRHLRARMMQQYWQSKAKDTNSQTMSSAETVALDGSWADGHVINMRNKEHVMVQFNLSHALGVINTDIYAYQFNSEFSNWLQQELTAFNERQFGRDIASPRLLAMSGVPARVEQGVQIPYCEATCCGSAMNFNRHDALVFETTPYITTDQRIILSVSIAGEYFNAAEISNIANRVIAYGVNMDNGGTLIIGGLSRSGSVKTAVMPEWLTDIPIIGRFIQSSSFSEERMELILFITATIVDENSRAPIIERRHNFNDE